MHALQPLSIGEIVDRSVTLAVVHWRPLLALVLMEALPMGCVRALLPQSRPMTLLSFALDVLLISLLYVAAILITVSPDRPALGGVLKAAVQRFGVSLVTLLLSSVWLAFWIFVTAVAGVVVAMPFTMDGYPVAGVVAGAVGGGFVGLLALPRAGLVAATMLPIVTLERVSPWMALGRARRRVDQAGFRRSTLLGLAIFAVSYAPAIVSSAVVDTVVDATHLEALRVVDEFFADAVSLGLGVVLSTVAALELRARTEGADLEATLSSG